MLSLEFEIARLECSPLALRNASTCFAELPVRAQRARMASRPTVGIAPNRSGSVAILPLRGVLVQRPGLLTTLGLATSTQQFTQALRAALADKSVAKILIDADTPGGSIYGTDELAAEIYRARSIKPIVGVSNSLCASGGYWILSQCSELYCTPSGEVGSIGVYTGHTDYSKALEEDGLNITLISAGKFKTEGNPYGPLTDEARAAIQQSVDNYYSMFTNAVSRGRGVPVAQVRGGMGQGRCLPAADALKQRMIDGVATLDEVARRLAITMNPRLSTAARSLGLLH